jgi:hypothetical protein
MYSIQKNIKAWIDMAAAIAYVVMFALLILRARAAAEHTVRLYGYNIDSGAHESLAADLYFAPGSILFTLAAIALLNHWRHARFFHYVAWIWFLLPFGAVAVFWLSKQ